MTSAALSPIQTHAHTEPDGVTLGYLAFAEDDFAAARDHWQSAFHRQRAGGDMRAAARTGANLALLYATVLGNEALGAGWLARARRLVAPLGRCVEQGYLALAYLSVHRDDLAAVERDAAFALELAVEFGDSDLEVLALVESGFAYVAQGRVADGFSRMDEAMAAIAAGEISDLSIVGRCMCVMLAACQRVSDLRRAEEWTEVLVELFAAQGGPPRILQTHCRVAYGALLKSIGRWEAAEAALLEAVSPTASRSFLQLKPKLLRAGAVAELADLRVLQGRLGEAGALLRPYEDWLEAAGALARLHLARGEPALAAAKIHRALRHIVADRLREGALVGQLVEVELARGNLEGAAAAAVRLSAVAAEVEGTTLRAEAALATGRVAAANGNNAGAVDHLEEALRFLGGGGGYPLLTGVIRFELAGVLQTSEAVVEARAALAIFDRLGARAYADRTAALLRRLGDSERTRMVSLPAAVGALTSREGDVLDLVRQGLTNAQIGERLFISPKTAEHHVSSMLGKLGVRSRAEAAAMAVVASAR